MKFSISRDRFLAQLGVAVRGVSTRSAIQTLSGVLVRSDEGRVELQATDMELGVRVRVDATAERDGRVVLPGRLLLDVVRSVPRDELTLEYRTSEQDVVIESGPSRFNLRTLPAEDFPKLPEPGAEAGMSVPTQAFVETISRVARSASRDETRPHLTGVLVSASERDLRMVATDSYRLSVKETVLEHPVEGSLEANVPARTLQELTRVAAAASRRPSTSSRCRTRSYSPWATWCSRPGSWRGASPTTASSCPRPTSTSSGSAHRSCSTWCGA